MSNLPYLIASLVGIGSLFFSVCGLLYLLYLHIKDEKSRQAKHIKIDQEVSQHIKNAEEQGRQIVAQAMQEAQKIISDAKYIQSSAAKTFDQTLTQVGSTMVQRFTNNAEEFDKQYTEAFNHLKQEYAKKADQTFTSVEQLTREEFDKKMNEEFEHVKQQMMVYRENQLKRVDQEINKIIVQVLREVLGRSITMADHEKLVVDSLEQAKKEGMFAS